MRSLLAGNGGGNMGKFRLFPAFLLLTFPSLFSAYSIYHVKSDAGPPPPSMTFYFYSNGHAYNTEAITSIVLYVCKTPTCEQFTLFPPPEGQREPWQKIRCNRTHCLAVGVPSSKYYRLAVQIESQWLTSNVFVKRAYSAKYYAEVTSDALNVKEVPLSNYSFLEIIGCGAVSFSGPHLGGRGA